MTSDPLTATPNRAPARIGIPRPPRRRALALSGALAVLGLVAAACGGGSGDTTASPAGVEAVPVADAPAPEAASGEFISTRPGAGIAAAGGNPQVVKGQNPCTQPDGPAAPIMIAYVGANLAELEAIGFESIIVEEPGLVIEAYVNEVNFNGGINGRCVEVRQPPMEPRRPGGHAGADMHRTACAAACLPLHALDNRSSAGMPHNRCRSSHRWSVRLHRRRDVRPQQRDRCPVHR